MDTGLRIVAVLAGGYLLGAVPFALIVGWVFHRVDVREHGSGNLGATNVLRVLGPQAGVATLLLDAAKGAAAVGLAAGLTPPGFSPAAGDWLLVGGGIAAMLGHSYTVFGRLRGGKGVATAAGVIAVLTPLAMPALVATFVVVVLVTRYVSLGSILLAFEYPLLTWALYSAHEARVVFAVGGSALVLWRHRANMRRLTRREEPRIEWKRDPLARRRRASGDGVASEGARPREGERS